MLNRERLAERQVRWRIVPASLPPHEIVAVVDVEKTEDVADFVSHHCRGRIGLNDTRRHSIEV